MLAIAIGLAWSNTFNVPFIYDDISNIVDNAFVHTLWDDGTIFSPYSSAIHLSIMRKVGMWTFRLNYAAGGLSLPGYHIVNLCIHIVNAMLAWAVVDRALRSDALAPHFGKHAELAAWAVAAAWALHPLQTEAVTYIVQRLESLMSLFYLATLFCWSRGVDRGELRWFVLAFVMCCLGMNTKEVMITAPFVVFLYDGIFLSPSWVGPLRRWPLYLALLVPAGVLVCLDIFVLNPALAHFPFERQVPVLSYLATEQHAVLHYLRLIVWPSPLIFDHGWPEARSFADIFPYAVVNLIACAAAAWGLFHRRSAGFAVASYFIILSPSSSVIPLMQDFVIEHRAYLPSLPIITLLLLGACRLTFHFIGSDRMLTPIFAAALSVLLCCLGGLTYLRNGDYQTVLALWADTVQKVPGNAKALFNLGLHQSRNGLLDEAEQTLLKAIDIDPTFTSSHIELENVYQRKGDLTRAEQIGRAAIRARPDLAEAHYQYAIVLNKLGRSDEAEAEYRLTLQLQPAHAQARVNLGALLARRGDLRGAAESYTRVLQDDPENAFAHFNLATVFERQEDYKSAAAEFRSAALADPKDAEARAGLARTLALLGDMNGARAAIAEALAIDPGNAMAKSVEDALKAQ